MQAWSSNNKILKKNLYKETKSAYHHHMVQCRTESYIYIGRNNGKAAEEKILQLFNSFSQKLFRLHSAYRTIRSKCMDDRYGIKRLGRIYCKFANSTGWSAGHYHRYRNRTMGEDQIWCEVVDNNRRLHAPEHESIAVLNNWRWLIFRAWTTPLQILICSLIDYVCSQRILNFVVMRRPIFACISVSRFLNCSLSSRATATTSHGLLWDLVQANMRKPPYSRGACGPWRWRWDCLVRLLYLTAYPIVINNYSIKPIHGCIAFLLSTAIPAKRRYGKMQLSN